MQLFESISGLPNKPTGCCQMQPGYVVAPLKQKGEKNPLSVGLYPIGLQGLYCPASRWKKEPIISNRDISGLMDGGTFMSRARF